MKLINRSLAALFGMAVFSGAAVADGPGAVRQLLANLSQARSSLSITEATARTQETLVKGIYAVYNTRGGFVGYVNDAGTLFGDSRGFTAVFPGGKPPRPFTEQEAKALREEIMDSIDYGSLVKVQKGNGGGRRILMFSAVDCPHCKLFEDAMRASLEHADTTIYVVPSALGKIRDGAAPVWAAAARIACAPDAGQAWTSYWATRVIPPARSCALTPQIAEQRDQQLKDILAAVGTRIVGTPQLVAEDGVSFVATPKTLATAQGAAAFGPGAAPRLARASRWLGAAESSTAIQSQEQQDQPRAVRVNLLSMFK
jgi:Thioredoxin-like domain